MTIKITNNCNYNCLHCMSNSSPKDSSSDMSLMTFTRALSFVNKTNSKNINITGGEIFTHSDFSGILNILKNTELKNVFTITFLSNGEYLFKDSLYVKELLKLMLENSKYHLQITNVKNIYTTYHSKESIKKAIIEKIGKYRYYKIADRIIMVDHFENGLVFAGRAKENLDKLKTLTFFYKRKVPRCFNIYNIISSLKFNLGNEAIDIIDVINYLKENSDTSKCIPLIKENGDLIFGEYDDCMVEYNIHLESTILDFYKLHGPCGSCYNSNINMEDIVNIFLCNYKNRHSKLNK